MKKQLKTIPINEMGKMLKNAKQLPEHKFECLMDFESMAFTVSLSKN